MLQIVFRFLEEILWCAILWYRILICSFRSRQIWCYLELLRFSKIFNNYAICLNLIWSCHTQCNGWHLQKQVCWKLILWIEICLFCQKGKSTFQCCYCGLSTSRVIIATFVPATNLLVGASFVWMPYENGKIQI